jgi:predicted Ser/Thr protein kinase
VSERLASETIVDGRYRIVGRVGSGGMADVYCAEDLQLGRRVALKVLHGRFAEDPEFVERFRREARSAAGLNHQHVVSVYDRGEWDGTYYIAMELLDGRSLKAIIQQEAPLDPARAIDLTVQILRAARFAHRRGIIHRDLKPHNVIVDDEGRAKVTDFGIARAGASDMTQTGSIMGTAQYLSPEQAQGYAVNETSDLYSIGVILYELLTGRVPFEGESAVTIALKHVNERPAPPSRFNPAVSPELEAVVLRALEKDPARRFPDADAFTAALEHARAALHGTGAFGPPTGAEEAAYYTDAGPFPPAPYDEVYGEEPAARRWWAWLLGLLVVAAIAVGAFFLLRDPGTDQVAVPDVVGTDQAAARTALEREGFTVQTKRASSDEQAEGTVIATDPAAGDRADKGSSVTVTVSSGPATAKIPTVGGLTRSSARGRLQRAGFDIEERREASDSVASGRAIRTSPPSGTTRAKGSTVSRTSRASSSTRPAGRWATGASRSRAATRSPTTRIPARCSSRAPAPTRASTRARRSPSRWPRRRRTSRSPTSPARARTTRSSGCRRTASRSRSSISRWTRRRATASSSRRIRRGGRRNAVPP